MEMLQHAVNWVELPAEDFNRAKKFYSTIYDYEMPEMQMGSNKMGFLLFDQQNGGIGAAIVQGEGYVPSTDGPKIYLNGGRDLNTVLSRIEGAGGSILMQKTAIGQDFGFMALFQDSEGNHVFLHSIE